MINEHSDDLQVSGKHEESLDEMKILYLRHLETQKMIGSARLRYQEDMLRRQMDAMIQNIVKTFLNTAARKVTKGVFLPI